MVPVPWLETTAINQLPLFSTYNEISRDVTNLFELTNVKFIKLREWTSVTRVGGK